MRLRPSTVVEYLECPRCAVRVDGFEPEALRGIHVCFKRRCGQHWWAMRLAAGPIEPQLAIVFGPELAADLMRTWMLPREAPRPLYWQLSLTRHQSTQLKSTGSSRYFRLITTLLRLQDATLVAAAPPA